MQAQISENCQNLTQQPTLGIVKPYAQALYIDLAENSEEIVMKKVAVFGNAGGGKSTLSQRLADLTGLSWVPLDRLKYKPGGDAVPHTEFKTAHDQLLQQDQWIIDGFGSLDTVWERLGMADTLVYLDMLVLRHYWWVTKRFLQSV